MSIHPSTIHQQQSNLSVLVSIRVHRTPSVRCQRRPAVEAGYESAVSCLNVWPECPVISDGYKDTWIQESACASARLIGQGQAEGTAAQECSSAGHCGPSTGAVPPPARADRARRIVATFNSGGSAQSHSAVPSVTLAKAEPRGRQNRRRISSPSRPRPGGGPPALLAARITRRAAHRPAPPMRRPPRQPDLCTGPWLGSAGPGAGARCVSPYPG